MDIHRKGPGAPKGSKNADKGHNASLNIKMEDFLKNGCVSGLMPGETITDFVRIAMAKELALRDPGRAEQFGIVDLLRKAEAPKEKLPRWTAGLSERAAQCLVKAGYRGKVAVKKDVAGGLELGSLQNMGPRQVEEVRAWLGV